MSVSGNEIKMARQNARMTLKMVAAIYGYNGASTAWQWENEGWKRNIGAPPPKDILQKISEVSQYGLTAQPKSDPDQDSDETAEGDEGIEEGVPDFGQWLRAEREGLKWSVTKLAEESGITPAQIHNIENGKTVNPQEATKNYLATALKLKVPADVEEKTEEALKVTGLGRLIDIDDAHSIDSFPELPGVYVLYDVSERPIYVGKAKNIKLRIRGHLVKFWYKPPIIVTASYIRVEDKDMRHQLEQVLIKFLKSNAVLNIQSVQRPKQTE